MAADNSVTELSKLAGSVSASPLFLTSFDSHSWFVIWTSKFWFLLVSSRTVCHKVMGLAEKVTQTVDSTGNQTRDYRRAGVNFVTELSMLAGSVSTSYLVMRSFDSQSFFVSWTSKLWFPIISSRTVCCKVMGLAKKVTQTVESTCNQTRDYRLVGDNSTNGALFLEGSLSAFTVFMTSFDSHSWSVS